MNNDVIKLMLVNKKSRVYSLIVQLHFDKIQLYKASIFKVWLANDLGISADLINEGSITAAFARHRKKLSRQPDRKAANPGNERKDTNFNTDIPDTFPGFN